MKHGLSSWVKLKVMAISRRLVDGARLPPPNDFFPRTKPSCMQICHQPGCGLVRTVPFMSTSQGGDILPTLLCCDWKNLNSRVACLRSKFNGLLFLGSNKSTYVGHIVLSCPFGERYWDRRRSFTRDGQKCAAKLLSPDALPETATSTQQPLPRVTLFLRAAGLLNRYLVASFWGEGCC